MLRSRRFFERLECNMSSSVESSMDLRQEQLKNWVTESFSLRNITLEPLAHDASFRRYFRFYHQGKSWIAMDAPPDKEPCFPFVKITRAFIALGLKTPEIFAEDIKRGFLILSDFGNHLYVNCLTNQNVEQLYTQAIENLLTIQKCQHIPDYPLSSFLDSELMLELDLFSEWFIQKYLEIDLTIALKKTLKEIHSLLWQNATIQPQVCIHRDYHSRNLMMLKNGELGILDFQDAMQGPITYDLVSLLRDCYIDWPFDLIQHCATYYFDRALDLQLLHNNISLDQFLRWFDLMGIQRHLKASFIFARKFLRDQNSTYLNYIPRTLNYIKYVSMQHTELKELHHLFCDLILPVYYSKTT